MKLKVWAPIAISTFVLPAITLISCSNDNQLTSDEIDEQTFLVNQAATSKYSPKVELKSDIKISEIDSKIINFENIPEDDKKLSYEILNFEIPLVGAVDANVNVKVSSKLSSDIFSTYSFKISSAIIPNEFAIRPMTKEDFIAKVDTIYFKNGDFFSNLVSDISVRIGEASDNLDISLQKNENNVTKSIFDIPAEKEIFINKLETYIQPTIINKMNEEALQQGIKIEVVDIIKDENFVGKISVNIIFGAESIYNLNDFSVTSFSKRYFELENELSEILSKKVKPSLMIGGTTNSIPIWDLYKYLSVVFPDDLNINNDFIIGINTSIEIPAAPQVSEEFEVYVEVFSKDFSDRIKGEYSIKIKDITNYEAGLIDFTATKPIILSSISTLNLPKNGRRNS